MARTRSDDSSQPATAETTTPTKKQAVAEALAMGIESPTKIAERLKSVYSLDITPNYVSLIKGDLGKTKKRKGRKPGRKPKVTQASTEQPARKTATTAKEGGLTPQDLRLLGELAGRAGGFGRLREFIDVLGNVR
jgi:hypothetical protein